MKTIIIDGVEYELHPKKKTIEFVGEPVFVNTVNGHLPTCASLTKTLTVYPPRPSPCDCGYEKPATEEVLDLLVNIRQSINEIDTRLWVLSGWWR